jgi:hypothetical protein
MIRIIFIKTGAGQTYPPRKSQKRTPSIYAGYQVKRGNLVGADQAEQEHAGKPPATRGPAAGGARCAQNQKAKQPTNKSTKMRRSCLLSGALSDDETRRRSFAKTGSGQTNTRYQSIKETWPKTESSRFFPVFLSVFCVVFVFLNHG